MKYGDLFKSDINGIDLVSASIPFEVKKWLTFYTIKQEHVGKPWVVAQAVYGDYRLWWVLMKANNLRIGFITRDTFRVRGNNRYSDNIVTDFSLGKVVGIPSIDDVNNYISKVNSNGA